MLYNTVARARDSQLTSVVFRDFSGGLSTVDSPYNLSYKYCTQLNNMLIDDDTGLLSRNGVRVLCNLDAYSAHWPLIPVTVSASIEDTTTLLRINWPAHGLSSGQKISIASASVNVGGVTIGGTYEVVRTDDDNFSLTVADPATDTETVDVTFTLSFYEPWDFQGADIIHVHYFQDHAIVFLNDGKIVAVNSLGIPRIIFSSAIAKTLAGSPSGWGAVEYVSTTVGNGELIATNNGLHKKLVIDLTKQQQVQYLHDPATGSNLNVPLGSYVHRVGQYLCCSTPDNKVAITARSTNGTFVGDPPPNDATTFDVTGYSAESDEITGLSQFRGRLIVGLQDVSLAIALGGYNDNSNHVPEIGEDVFTGFGNISHKTMIPVGNELLFADAIAINAMSVAITKTFIPKQVSEQIANVYIAKIRNLSVGSTKHKMFAVRYPRINAYIIFVPDDDACTTYTGFMFRNSAWSTITGINPVAGCATLLQDLLLCDRRRILLMSDDNTFTDFVDDYDVVWEYASLITTGTRVRASGALASYEYIGKNTFVPSGAFNPSDVTQWKPVAGVPINVAARSPWIDLHKRNTLKLLRRIGLDSEGEAEFNMKVFGDAVDEALIDIDFVAGGHRGFGYEDQPYGGGRTNWDARLYGVPGKCERFSWYISGQIEKRLKIVAVNCMMISGGSRV